MYTDEKLLNLLKHDREKAAQILVEQYSPLLRSICASKLENPEDVNECVNDTFAEFFLHCERYDQSKSSLKNYLGTIARRKSIDRFRKNCRQIQLQNELMENHMENHVQQTNHNMEDERLEEAMEKLSPIDRQILQMHYYDDMSYKEISEELDMSYEKVKKRGLRGKKKLLYLLLLGILVLCITACTGIILKKHGLLPTWFPFYDMIPGETSDDDTTDDTNQNTPQIPNHPDTDNQESQDNETEITVAEIIHDTNSETVPDPDLDISSSAFENTETITTPQTLGKNYQYSDTKGLLQSDSPAYELEENTQIFTKDSITYELQDAFYQDGYWEFSIVATCLDESLLGSRVPSDTFRTAEERLEDILQNAGKPDWLQQTTLFLNAAHLQLPSGAGVSLTCISCDATTSRLSGKINAYLYHCYCNLTPEEDGNEILEATLVLSDGNEFHMLLKRLPVNKYIDITDDSDTPADTESDRIHLKTDICTVKNGTAVVCLSQTGITDYKVADLITQSYMGYIDGTQPFVSLNDEDGNQYRSHRITKQDVTTDTEIQRNFELYFQGINAGKYTLSIPCIGLTKDQSTSSVEIPLPAGDDDYMECDLTILFPDGSGYHITGIERSHEIIEYISDDNEDNVFKIVEVPYWYYEPTFEPISEDEEIQFCFSLAKGTSSTGHDVSCSISRQYYKWTVVGGEKPESLTLSFYNPVYILNKEYSFNITIQE